MKLLSCSLLLLLATTSGFGEKHRHRRSSAVAQFDHYLFVLSWSPEYCHSHPGSTQCTAAKPFSFVVHGLWPEYASGGSGPENCSSASGPSNPSQYLDIMPDLGLIQHEWSTHGTCSGLDADAYFGLIRRAYNSMRVPAHFATLSTAQTESPQQIKKEFESSNSSLSDNSLQINCASYYLQAVEICLDKSLAPIACSVPRDCRAQTIHIPPVR